MSFMNGIFGQPKISGAEGSTGGQQAGENGNQGGQQADGTNQNGNQQQQQQQTQENDPWKDIYGDGQVDLNFDLDPEVFQTQNDQTVAGGGNTDPTPDGQTPEHKQMVDSLKAKIGQVTLPEDFFPDDFNFQDPKALRGKMNQIMQNAIGAALGIMSDPVSAAMQSMAKTLREEMKTSIQQGNVKSDAQKAFQPIHSALNGDKGMQQLALDMFKRSMKTTKSVEQSQRAVVEALKGIGVSINLKAGTSNKIQRFGDFNGQPQGRQSQQQGSSDLDAFMADFSM